MADIIHLATISPEVRRLANEYFADLEAHDFARKLTSNQSRADHFVDWLAERGVRMAVIRK